MKGSALVYSPYNPNPRKTATYTKEFFKHQGETARASAPAIIELVLNGLKENPVVVTDIGCGGGEFLKELYNHIEVGKTAGYDGKWASCFTNPGAVLPTEYYFEWDIEKEKVPEFVWDDPVDLTFCLETLEHLTPEAGDRVLDYFEDHSNIVILSAGAPGQGGTDHINLQTPGYWAERMAERGFGCEDYLRPLLWENQAVSWWYSQNILFFYKDESNVDFDRICSYLDEAFNNGPLHYVHPKMILE